MAEEFERLLSLHEHGVSRILDLSQRWSKNRQEALKTLEFMAELYRDIIILAEGGVQEHVIHASHLPMLMRAAERTSGDHFTAILESVEDAREALESNANVQLTMDNLLLNVRNQKTPGEKRA